ncbi:MAG: hypothetical protein E7K64_03030 [Clostridia bacterium]|nr:hypothetical protein [Clostridia bacterium]
MVYLIEVDKDGNALQLAMVEGKPEYFSDSAAFVPFETYEEAQSVLGKRYVDGEWQAVPQEPAPPELSQTEKDLLAIMEGVAATYERQEKTGLDIMEGIAGLYEATLSGGNV